VKAAATTLLLLSACSREKPEAKPVAIVPPPAAVSVAPPPSVPAQEDISWLVGTWERQSGAKDWLLFNAPKEVVVLSGKPAAVAQRGEFVPHGRFVSLFFKQSGGVVQERELEAPPDRSELRENGPPPATYRRGAPP